VIKKTFHPFLCVFFQYLFQSVGCVNLKAKNLCISLDSLRSVIIFAVEFLIPIIMSVNKVILIGNVGKDPDVRYLDNHVCVANLTLATTERGYIAQNGTQVPDRTEWHNLVFWRGLAETVEKYVHKGDKLYIEGSIRNRSYDDQNGIKRYVTEIFVDFMEMLSSRQQGKQDAQPQQAQASAPAQPGSGNTDIPF
jgi:single-strand DNA-binding protein